MPQITVLNENKTLQAEEGSNLRKVLLKNGISPYTGKDKFLNCLGNGLCGTCRVEVVEGKGLPPVSPMEELAMVGMLPFYARSVGKNVRLSCQLPLKNDISINTHPPAGTDKQLTKERLSLTAVWTVFGGAFMFVMVRLLIEIATGR